MTGIRNYTSYGDPWVTDDFTSLHETRILNDQIHRRNSSMSEALYNVDPEGNVIGFSDEDESYKSFMDNQTPSSVQQIETEASVDSGKTIDLQTGNTFNTGNSDGSTVTVYNTAYKLKPPEEIFGDGHSGRNISSADSHNKTSSLPEKSGGSSFVITSTGAPIYIHRNKTLKDTSSRVDNYTTTKITPWPKMNVTAMELNKLQPSQNDNMKAGLVNTVDQISANNYGFGPSNMNAANTTDNVASAIRQAAMLGNKIDLEINGKGKKPYLGVNGNKVQYNESKNSNFILANNSLFHQKINATNILGNSNASRGNFSLNSTSNFSHPLSHQNDFHSGKNAGTNANNIQFGRLKPSHQADLSANIGLAANPGYPISNPKLGGANTANNLSVGGSYSLENPNLGSDNLMSNPNTGGAYPMNNPYIGAFDPMNNPFLGNANVMTNPIDQPNGNNDQSMDAKSIPGQFLDETKLAGNTDQTNWPNRKYNVDGLKTDQAYKSREAIQKFYSHDSVGGDGMKSKDYKTSSFDELQGKVGDTPTKQSFFTPPYRQTQGKKISPNEKYLPRIYKNFRDNEKKPLIAIKVNRLHSRPFVVNIDLPHDGMNDRSPGLPVKSRKQGMDANPIGGAIGQMISPDIPYQENRRLQPESDDENQMNTTPTLYRGKSVRIRPKERAYSVHIPNTKELPYFSHIDRKYKSKNDQDEKVDRASYNFQDTKLTPTNISSNDKVLDIAREHEKMIQNNWSKAPSSLPGFESGKQHEMSSEIQSSQNGRLQNSTSEFSDSNQHPMMQNARFRKPVSSTKPGNFEMNNGDEILQNESNVDSESKELVGPRPSNTISFNKNKNIQLGNGSITEQEWKAALDRQNNNFDNQNHRGASIDKIGQKTDSQQESEGSKTFKDMPPSYWHFSKHENEPYSHLGGKHLVNSSYIPGGVKADNRSRHAIMFKNVGNNWNWGWNSNSYGGNGGGGWGNNGGGGGGGNNGGLGGNMSWGGGMTGGGGMMGGSAGMGGGGMGGGRMGGGGMGGGGIGGGGMGGGGMGGGGMGGGGMGGGGMGGGGMGGGFGGNMSSGGGMTGDGGMAGGGSMISGGGMMGGGGGMSGGMGGGGGMMGGGGGMGGGMGGGGGMMGGGEGMGGGGMGGGGGMMGGGGGMGGGMGGGGGGGMGGGGMGGGGGMMGGGGGMGGGMGGGGGMMGGGGGMGGGGMGGGGMGGGGGMMGGGGGMGGGMGGGGGGGMGGGGMTGGAFSGGAIENAAGAAAAGGAAGGGAAGGGAAGGGAAGGGAAGGGAAGGGAAGGGAAGGGGGGSQFSGDTCSGSPSSDKEEDAFPGTFCNH